MTLMSRGPSVDATALDASEDFEGADLWLMRIRSFETRRKHNVALRVSHCQVEEDEDISQQSFKILYRYRIGR